MLQLRLPHGDSRLFSPARDPALHGQWALKEVARRIRDRDNPMLEHFIDKFGISRELVAEGMLALARAYCLSLTDAKVDFYGALDQSGFFKLDMVSQALLMAAFGQLEFSVAWHGMRQATAGGSWPGLDERGLVKMADEAVTAAYNQTLKTKE